MKLSEERKLSDICQVRGGYAFKSKDFKANGIPLVRISNIKNERVEIEEGCVYLEEKYFLNYKEYQINKGDILIALSGATTGKFGIYELDTPALLNQRVGMIKMLKRDKVLSNFLYYYIYSITKKILKKAHGAAQPNISTKSVENFNITLFPISKQKKIVQILDTANSIRQKRKEQLKLLDEYLKSVFLEMLGDQKRKDSDKYLMDNLKANGKGTFSNGPFGSDLLTSELNKTSGIPVVYIRDLRGGEFNWISGVYVSEEKANLLSNCIVLPNDILIAKVGDPPGITAVAPCSIPKAIITQDVIRFRVNKYIVHPLYLKHYINSEIGKHLIESITIDGTRKRFPLSVFKKLEITLPNLDLQNKFASIVEQVEQTKQKMRTSLDEMDNHFNALMQRYFG